MSGKAGHPAYFDPQTEKAFMKQDGIFANKKELLNKGSKRAPRSVSFSFSNILSLHGNSAVTLLAGRAAVQYRRRPL
jgi:hypothetical protein